MEFRELLKPDGSRAQALQGNAFRESVITYQFEDYIDGVRCLMKKPGTTSGRTEWDEMSNLHLAQNDINHGYSRFLPWHRLFLLSMEEALTRCLGKPVAIPYWNSAIDASLSGGVRSSPLFKHFDGEGKLYFFF